MKQAGSPGGTLPTPLTPSLIPSSPCTRARLASHMQRDGYGEDVICSCLDERAAGRDWAASWRLAASTCAPWRQDV
jgi:hypothetical protein